MNDISKIERRFVNESSGKRQEKLPVRFGILKDQYELFLKKTENSDMGKSVTYYMTEASQLKNLIAAANESNLQDYAAKYQEKLDSVLAILKEAGIAYKD